MTAPLVLHNAAVALRDAVPQLDLDAFRRTVVEAPRAGRRVAALFAAPAAEARIELFAVVAVDAEGCLEVVRTTLAGAVHMSHSHRC
jgi:hypothetical protein